ncbi:MAG: ATP-binding cassette domain-containing protein [Lachnospiraceae bacterium]|nr:ATP-binding cassette domain-containing protein [Lachnospiraceae bacterium]
MTFGAGRKYAIVGESGKGKSTLMRLLMKYLLRASIQERSRSTDRISKHWNRTVFMRKSAIFSEMNF